MPHTYRYWAYTCARTYTVCIRLHTLCTLIPHAHVNSYIALLCILQYIMSYSRLISMHTAYHNMQYVITYTLPHITPHYQCYVYSHILTLPLVTLMLMCGTHTPHMLLNTHCIPILKIACKITLPLRPHTCVQLISQ